MRDVLAERENTARANDVSQKENGRETDKDRIRPSTWARGRVRGTEGEQE